MKYFAIQTTLSDEAIEKALKNQGSGTLMAEGPWQRAAELTKYLHGESLVLLICRHKSMVGVEWVAVVDNATYQANSSTVEFSRFGALTAPVPLSRFERHKDGKPLSDKYPRPYVVCLFDKSLSKIIKFALGPARKSAPPKAKSSVVGSYVRQAVEVELNNDPKVRNLSATAKTLLIEARIGQGAYRADLMKLWGGKCAVTGCDIAQVLVASHAKPWAESSNNERLDAYNGLLLSAHVDRLFDSGLISFSNNGELLVSDRVDDVSLAALGLSKKTSLRFVRKEHIPYLAAHRARNDF